MIINNLTTSTISFIGDSGLPYEVPPNGQLSLANGEIPDVELNSLVSRGIISITGWSMGAGTAPSVAAPFTITQTVVTLTAATSAALVPANPSRRYLSFMVTGANDVTVVPTTGPAVAGAGIIYQAQAAGKQGASQEFPTGAPTNAFSAISTSGSTVTVWEGV